MNQRQVNTLNQSTMEPFAKLRKEQLKHTLRTELKAQIKRKKSQIDLENLHSL
jgi:transcriptional regulator of NAD metabolism